MVTFLEGTSKPTYLDEKCLSNNGNTNAHIHTVFDILDNTFTQMIISDLFKHSAVRQQESHFTDQVTGLREVKPLAPSHTARTEWSLRLKSKSILSPTPKLPPRMITLAQEQRKYDFTVPFCFLVCALLFALKGAEAAHVHVAVVLICCGQGSALIFKQLCKRPSPRRPPRRNLNIFIV